MTVQSRASGMDRIRLTGERQFFQKRFAYFETNEFDGGNRFASRMFYLIW